MKSTQNNKSAIFTSAHVEWGTPPDLYLALDKEFSFNFDPCRSDGIWDGREVSWVGKRVFCNPPYGRGVDKWLDKGPEALLAVFLLPARTDTKWFHDYALKADEIRFFRGRLHFSENHIAPKTEWHQGAPFPSMLVIYRHLDYRNAIFSDKDAMKSLRYLANRYTSEEIVEQWWRNERGK